MTFRQLGLCPQIAKACEDRGYKAPTKIQEEAIVHLLRKRDLLAIAKTGTGKTAAFVLPILQDIENQKKEAKSDSRVLTKLIIAPTRELVLQLEKSIESYAKYLDIKICSVYGGANIKTQIRKLDEKVNIVIATTGRLMDLIKQDKINVTKIDTLILDEADSMLDMGFVADIQDILSSLTLVEQIILCSATLGPNVKKLSAQIMQNPKVIEIKANDRVNDKIEQIAYPVTLDKKLEMLSFLIGSKNMKQVLVFCKTKASAEEIVSNLKLDGLKAASIHGDKTHGARTKAITQFKEGQIRVLVATDVAARGLDIVDLYYVINFDLPFMPIDYVHRIGRTARAGKNGIAISLLDEYDVATIRDVEKYVGQKIPKLDLEGFEVGTRIKMIATKKIVETKDDIKRKKVGGAFGNKKKKKEQKSTAKQRGKRIIGQKSK
ncbi:DEAD/DEAH box helicase [Arcobacter sp. 15-2]|uniref:DEAD/DEAH box helicase n=1 Tax=Arcobacter sp. 15-2 TaxID=3374109 RepID=UPI00399CAEAE